MLSFYSRTNYIFERDNAPFLGSKELLDQGY